MKRVQSQGHSYFVESDLLQEVIKTLVARLSIHRAGYAQYQIDRLAEAALALIMAVDEINILQARNVLDHLLADYGVRIRA